MLPKGNVDLRQGLSMLAAEGASRGHIHAIIPMAGKSSRMGKPKLLLPWRGTTVVESLLSFLLDADLAAVWMLTRADDEPLLSRIEAFQQRLPANQSARLRIITADPAPAEMRDSVAILIKRLRERESPAAEDAWMLIPADAVAVRTETIGRLIEQWRQRPQGVLIPTHAGRRGHPTLFGWALAEELPKIPATFGINWLLRQPDAGIRELPVEDRGVLCDLDTPQDYEAWRPDKE